MGPGGLWFDFSIGEGGGAIELIQKLEGGNCFEAGRFILENGWAHASVNLSLALLHKWVEGIHLANPA